MSNRGDHHRNNRVRHEGRGNSRTAQKSSSPGEPRISERDKACTKRNKRAPKPDSDRPETLHKDLGFIHAKTQNTDLGAEIKNVLGPVDSFHKKYPKVSMNPDGAVDGPFGIDLRRQHSVSNKPRPESKPSQPESSTISPALHHKNTLNLLFSSVRHLISPISPLSSPQPTQIDNCNTVRADTTIPSPTSTRIPTMIAESKAIQIGCVDSTVGYQPLEQLWISVNLARLQRISGLTEKIKTRISGLKRRRPEKEAEKSKKRDRPSKKRPKVTQETPKESVPTTVVEPSVLSGSSQRTSRTSPILPRAEPNLRIPKPTRDRRSPQKPVKKIGESTESPVKVKDADTTTITREPDSSTMISNLYGHEKYTELLNQGKRSKEKGEDFERSGAHLNSFIDYTEAIAFFNMAAYLLEQELDQLIKRRNAEGKTNNLMADIGTRSLKIETLVCNNNMELCYKIRTYYQQRARQMKPEELQILERLIIMCFRCEAKLNLLLVKTKTSQYQPMEKQIKTNQHLVQQIDQQNTADRRQSPDSPVMPQNNDDYWMCKEDWRAIARHCQIANYMMKAHTKWAEAEKLQANQKVPSHIDFFSGVPSIAGVSDLKLYESSLKDLFLYQKAVVNKLRDELTS